MAREVESGSRKKDLPQGLVRRAARRGLCGSGGTMYTFHCNYFALTNSPSVNEKGLLCFHGNGRVIGMEKGCLRF